MAQSIKKNTVDQIHSYSSRNYDIKTDDKEKTIMIESGETAKNLIAERHSDEKPKTTDFHFMEFSQNPDLGKNFEILPRLPLSEKYQNQ